MKTKAKFMFLGTGASAGVPVIGCYCEVCKDPKSQRLRPSGLLRVFGKNILIDVGPDFREQALKANIDHLDGVLLTHTHYDHIAGVDELRIFYLRTKKSLPCLLSKESFADLQKRYDYLFRPVGEGLTLSAQLQMEILEREYGGVTFLGLPIVYMSYSQGGTKVTGYRIGDFAYLSDIRDYDPSIFHHLRGVKNLVISALREEPSPLHLSLEEAVAFSKKVGAEKTRVTHISHKMNPHRVNQKLPSTIQLGYDGEEMEFEL